MVQGKRTAGKGRPPGIRPRSGTPPGGENAARALWTIPVLAAIVLFAVWLETLTPFFGDDFSYSVSFVTKEPLASLGDLLASQRLHYHTTNGRAVVHTLAQLFLWMGRPGIDLVFGLLLGTLCLLVCVYAKGTLAAVRPWQPGAVFLFLWFFTPHFGGSFLWKMGAANYLLSPQLILLFFLPYRRALSGLGVPGGRLWAVAMGLFGLLAGWTNENTSLALVTMLLLTLLVCALRRTLALWMGTGLAGAAAGAALLFFSPAQKVRLEGSGGLGGPELWLSRVEPILLQALRCLWPLLVLWVLALILLAAGRGQRRDLAPAWVLLAGFGISMASMAASPEFPLWAWSSIQLFALCFTAALLGEAGRDLPDPAPILQITAVAAAVVAVAVSWRFIGPEVHRVHDEFAAREAVIAQAKAAGEQSVTVSGIATLSTYSSYSLFPELGEDSGQWPNTAVANYYGLTSVSLDGPAPLIALKEGE